jgi:hypothetical protein
VTRLMALGEKLKAKFHRSFVGTRRMVLAEPAGEGWTDNYLRVRIPPGIPPGSLLEFPVTPLRPL